MSWMNQSACGGRAVAECGRAQSGERRELARHVRLIGVTCGKGDGAERLPPGVGNQRDGVPRADDSAQHLGGETDQRRDPAMEGTLTAAEPTGERGEWH